MMKRILLRAVLLFVSFSAYSQEIDVKSYPDTTAILIGDQIGFTVSATFPRGTGVRLDTKADTLAGKIVILGKSPRDTATAPDGKMTITDRYLITSYDSGNYSIPPFFAEVRSGDSLKRYYSGYSFLNVTRPDVTPGDTTDVIFDIVPPRKAPVTFGEIIPYLVIALIAAIVIYLLARFLPRNPLHRFVRPPAPREPAHIIALRELDKLKEEQLWQKGEIKEYYSRLSDIVRRYLDNRYAISSPELTTDETVRMLQKAAVTTHDQMSMVKELLSLSDMVKFAKYVPGTEMHERSFYEAVQFVEMTKEVAETAEGQAEKGGKNA